MVVTSNKVNGYSEAYIKDSGGAKGSIAVTGEVKVEAQDQAIINANTKLVSSSITTNDGGLSIASETFNDFLDADHGSDDTSVQLAFGDRVLFGQNCIHRDQGTLRVGDPIEVIE